MDREPIAVAGGLTYQGWRGQCEDWPVIRELVAAQTKAIPYSMELTDLGGPLIGSGSGYYGAYNPYVPGVAPGARVTTPMSQREAFVHGQVYAGTEPVDWLMDAVNFIINAASAAEYHFEDEAGLIYAVEKDPNDPSDQKDAPDLLKNLFRSPNPYMGYRELLELTLIDWLLVGNAYWVKWKTNQAGQPLALYRMAPAFVRVVPGQFGVEKYLYRVPGVQNEVVFDPSQILHFKRPNPHDPYYGAGIVKGGARAIDMELALTNTSARYYENQALPSGAVETERRVPRDVFKRLKSQLHSFYSGSQNAGQLMVLEAGLKFTPIAPNAGQAMFQPMGAWSRDRIFAMFNINKKLLGIADADGRDPTPISDWQHLFDQKTMLPLCSKFSEAISTGLTMPAWNLEFKIDYEETLAVDDMVQRTTLLAAVPGVKVHELRAAAGLPPSTGDAAIDNTVLNLPGPELDANGNGGFADRNLPGEAGRPPLPSNTRKIAGSPAAVAGGNRSRVAGKSMGLSDLQLMIDRMTVREHVIEGKALAPANVHVGKISTAIPPEDKLYSERTVSLDNLAADTKRDILNAVHELERGLLDASEGKAQGTMYQRVKNSKAWAAFRKRLGDILESHAQRALSFANMQHAKAGFPPNLDTDYVAVARELVYRPEGVQSIVNNFKQEVLQGVLNLQRHGSNPGEYTKEIMAGVKKWEDGRADVVALTEATHAYNEGTILVAESGGMNLLVSDGEEDDEPCQAANGQVWTAEQARERRLEHPNCRRAFVPTALEITT